MYTAPMSQPQSPFDDSNHSDESAQESAQREWPPPRKWSFVVLGVVLFILVWVRELTQMDPVVTIRLSMFTLLVWVLLHWVTYKPDPVRSRERLRDRNLPASAKQIIVSRRSETRGDE